MRRSCPEDPPNKAKEEGPLSRLRQKERETKVTRTHTQPFSTQVKV